MGYMGFGMQKWIYTQRPRKIIENGKGYNCRYSDGLGSLSPSFETEEEFIDRTQKEIKQEKTRRCIKGIVSLLLITTVVILGVRLFLSVAKLL